MIRRIANRLLRWFCHPDFYADISGDLEELYLRNLERNRRSAHWKYLGQVIMLFRPALLKDFGQSSFLNQTGMLSNYFKISIRNLLRHKGYAAINVLGLAIGLAAFLLLTEYIRFEKSFDRYHKGSERIYRLIMDQIVDGQMGTRDAMSFAPSGKVLQDEVPEITDYTLTAKPNKLTFKKGETLVTESCVLWVDEHFLDVFQYEVLHGDKTQLVEPNSIILTQSKARFYFGEADPVGQYIHLYSGFDKEFKVVAVIEDVPLNTHYPFDLLLSLTTVNDFVESSGWNNNEFYTYLKVESGTDLKTLDSKLISVRDKYIGKNSTLFFNLQPVADIHLFSDFIFEPQAHGSYKTVKFLQLISVIILLIAWVNYINLSTAKSLDRAKEVGLRKVIGARKVQLQFQFLTEALLINTLGALLAILITILVAPYFNFLIGNEVIHDIYLSGSFLINLCLFTILGTLIAGFYPAFVLSNLNITSIVKGEFRTSKRGVILRKALVTTQFSASVILIAGTIIVSQQVEYMLSRDLGLDTDQVIGFMFPPIGVNYEKDHQQKLTFLQELEKSWLIKGTARISNLPGGGSRDINAVGRGIQVVGLTDIVEGTNYYQLIDDKLLDLLDIQILNGRNFKKDFSPDTSGVLINEAMVEWLGLRVSDELINQKIKLGTGENTKTLTIIGIVGNVNRSSLKNEVEPTMYSLWTDPGKAVVKISSENIRESLEYVETTWKEFFPTESLNYSFLDERYGQLYEEDQRFEAVFRTFSAFALFVAILGLFGLSAFMAAQRTKEVGVRKVLGASIMHIVSLFYREFLILIVVAAVVSVPLVYLFMNGWLENYAYRIDFPWYVMVLSVLIVLFSAFVTVGYQVWRVALLNPARTLRYE